MFDLNQHPDEGPTDMEEVQPRENPTEIAEAEGYSSQRTHSRYGAESQTFPLRNDNVTLHLMTGPVHQGEPVLEAPPSKGHLTPLSHCPTDSWIAKVPTTAYINSSTHSSSAFAITELHRISMPAVGHNSPVATSASGIPVYGAWLRDSNGILVHVQLFELVRIDIDAAIFVPLPDEHPEGQVTIEYEPRRFNGSIEHLSQSLSWPLSPVLPNHVESSVRYTLHNGKSLQLLEQAMTGLITGDQKGKGKAKEVEDPQPLPERCYPSSPCTRCLGFFGRPVPVRNRSSRRLHKGGDTPPVLKNVDRKSKKRTVQSRHGPKSKSSDYRGVTFYRRTGRWEAHIWHNGAQVYLGASKTKDQAARAYDKAALLLTGPDADINFKPEDYQEEIATLYRLSKEQLIILLRRDSRGRGSQVKYPGIKAVMKPGMGFEAIYKPHLKRKPKQVLGIYTLEEDALRAVFREAISRSNLQLASSLMDSYHVRSYIPPTEAAPGELPEDSGSRRKRRKPYKKRCKADNLSPQKRQKRGVLPIAPDPAQINSSRPSITLAVQGTETSNDRQPKRSKRLAEKTKKNAVSTNRQKSVAIQSAPEGVQNSVPQANETAQPAISDVLADAMSTNSLQVTRHGIGSLPWVSSPRQSGDPVRLSMPSAPTALPAPRAALARAPIQFPAFSRPLISSPRGSCFRPFYATTIQSQSGHPGETEAGFAGNDGEALTKVNLGQNSLVLAISETTLCPSLYNPSRALHNGNLSLASLSLQRQPTDVGTQALHDVRLAHRDSQEFTPGPPPSTSGFPVIRPMARKLWAAVIDLHASTSMDSRPTELRLFPLTPEIVEHTVNPHSEEVSSINGSAISKNTVESI